MFLPVQVERLVRAVRRPGVKHYCEVGFNGGHSSAAVLASTASVSVRSFDFGLYGRHTARNAAWLREMHPGRFRYVQGDSALTLPFLSAAVRSGHEPPCDVSSQCCTLGRMPWLSLAPAQRLHRCLLSAQAKASPLALHHSGNPRRRLPRGPADLLRPSLLPRGRRARRDRLPRRP